jgi:preprotein translocase subunit SecG
MSSLLRPVGHLPASVYWVRRALVLVVLVVLLVLLLRLFGGGGGAGGGQDPVNSAAQQATSRTPSEPGAGPNTAPTQSGTSGPAKAGQPNDTKCAGTDVRISVLPASRTITSGTRLNFAIRLSAVRTQCTATIDPTVLSLTITSGKDQIWTTTHCEQAISRATMILAVGKESTSTVAWYGRRSGPGCLPGQLVAKPGTYVATAVYDGRASTPQAFKIS